MHLLWAFYVSAPSAPLVTRECAVSLRASPTSVFHPPSTPPLSWKPFTRAPSGHWPPCRTAGVLRGETGLRLRTVQCPFPPGVPEVRADGGRLLCTCLFLNPKASCTLSSVKKNNFCYLLSLHVKIVGLCHVVSTGHEGCIVCMLVSLLTNDKQKHLSSILHQTAELSTNLYSYWE